MSEIDKCLMCEGTDTSGTGICDWCWLSLKKGTHKEEH